MYPLRATLEEIRSAGASRIRLFSGGLAKGGIDPFLPSRPVLLEKVEHVAVEAERHRLLGAR